MVMELLAPAGSYDVFKIAVNLGADAVYLAGQNFGARAYAENFTTEEIKKSVEYAHLNNAKVFITVNTLINNFEIIDFLKYIFKLYKIGVDAVIVQDFGVLKLLKSIFPEMKIHASTQMSLNNYYSVLWAKENGVSRVIFPRELSIDEISKIHKKLKRNDVDIELEVFSHGALCYSVSGNCYISSLNNGRSGNRGACTQPCRREYLLKYKGHKVGDGYLLSTHDLNLSDDLDKLSESGIDSIKLEGRMKSEDYVGTIVNSYRNLLNKKEGSFKDDLNLVFNRNFTKGYIFNQKPSEVMGRESSGHIGFYIGEITSINREYPEIVQENTDTKNKKLHKYKKRKSKEENEKDDESERRVRTVKEIKVSKKNPIQIEKGDGIAFKFGNKIKGIYIDDIIEQNEEYIVFNTTRNIRVGDKVYISYSKSIHKELKKYKKEFIQSKIPISLNMFLDDKLNIKVNINYTLNDDMIEFEYIASSKFEKAINRPIKKEEIEKQLSKTGNTPFFVDRTEINNFKNDIFIPVSKLNEIRREILEKATETLLNYYKTDKNKINDAKSRLNRFVKKYKSKKDLSKKELSKKELSKNLENEKIESTDLKSEKLESKNLSFGNNDLRRKDILGLSVFVDNIELVEVASSYNLNKIYFDPSYLYANPNDYFENIEKTIMDALSKITVQELVWVLPSLISDEEIEKCNIIFNSLKNKGVPISIMCDIPGIKPLFDFKLYGNHTLNVWNNFSCEKLSESGFNSLILSPELSFEEMKNLVLNYMNKDIDLEMIAHGNLEVIMTNDDFSNLNKNKSLNMDISEYAILEDKKRKKFKYKILSDFNKKSHIINKDCLCLIDEMDKIRKIGLDSIILDCRFSNENYTSNIISLYLEAINETNHEKLNSLKKEIYSLSHSYLSKGNFLDGRIHEKGKK
ncbi:MAG: U32 family peptidase [Methanobrevibacter sp.]|uniref:U32 family peptidase n=1 Tax=Methanobrevibacter sp. TaxID=66852 RepID=UPI002B2121AF|nr:U32 family peptidase [Methanobrevibacter sp.]MEA4956134.1 U32 family peptidase [Methanobrevibacter sp.]